MEEVIQSIYCKYNKMNCTDIHIEYEETALQLLKNLPTDLDDLNNKIRVYDREFALKSLDGELELKIYLKYEHPKSLINIIYIHEIIKLMEDDFFISIKLEKKKIVLLIYSIILYVFTLHTYFDSGLPLPKTSEKWLFKRKNFLLGLNELKKVSWEIEQTDYENFLNIFAFDILNRNINELNGEKLFNINNDMFILNIDDFLEYCLLKLESLYKLNNDEREFSKYQNKKGSMFEYLVYDYLKSEQSNIVHSVKYYLDNGDNEIDILVIEEKYLIIVECKSGVIELKSLTNDAEIKKEIHKKVNKAYKTLKRASKYIMSNDEFTFKNADKIINGNSKDYEVINLHITMYPIESLSSNIHTIDDKYIDEDISPIITISFEHLMAILIDCKERGLSFIDYLKKRKDYILKYPKVVMDVNELDLYHQMSRNSTIFSDFEKNNMFDLFQENIMFVSTYYNEFGIEVSPSQKKLDKISSGVLNFLFECRNVIGFNKRYITNLQDYITIK